MMTNSSCEHFQIADSYIEIFNGGDILTISDTDVEGVSTRVGRVEEWHQLPHIQRLIDIEYRSETGSIRLETIEISLNAGGYDFLVPYLRRVSEHAAENVLKELLAENRVERKGFTLTDEGMLISASGETLACELFDVKAIEITGDRSVIWTDNPHPFVLTFEDPNSQVVSKVLKKLVQSNGPNDAIQLVGTIRCERHGLASIKTVRFALVAVMLLSGVFTSVVVRMLLAGGIQVSLFQLLTAVVPVLLVGGFMVRKIAVGDVRISVLRSGLVIRRGNQLSEVPWEDCERMRILETTIFVGHRRSSHSLPACTLKLKTSSQHHFGSEIELTWQRTSMTELCTEYIEAKSASRRREAIQVPETANPA